jgi:thiol reductant ABC exporter CydD subunit
MSERVDRRLARETTSARAHFAAAALLGVLSSGTIVAQAALLAHIIAAAAMHHGTLASLRTSILALAAVLVARALLSGGFELSGRLGAGRVMAELRHRLVAQLLMRRPGLALGEQTGELATAAVQGVDSLENYFAGYLPSLVLATVVPVAILAAIVPVDLICAVILFITIPVLVTFMVLIGLGAQGVAQRRWQTLSLLSSRFLDTVAGLETLRAHRREQAQSHILADAGDRYRQETMSTLRLAFLSAFVLELCAMVGTALVAATIGVQLTGGHLSLTVGLTVLLLAPELYGPLRQVGQQFHASADGLASAGRVLTALQDSAGLQSVSAESDHSRATASPDPRHEAICFDDVSFAYPGRPTDVLSRLNLTLAAGETVALVGRSGAGKSTLAALALRLRDPTAGTVRCGMRDLRTVDSSSWRRRTAWVPQRATLFSGTLADNITLSRPDASEAEVVMAARDAGLDAVIAALPAGLQTRIGDGGRRLSVGQGQRVALARAFVADASLVILDEPTANLDPATALALGDAIIRLAQDRTVLLITHDRGLAARADRIVELQETLAQSATRTLSPADSGLALAA